MRITYNDKLVLYLLAKCLFLPYLGNQIVIVTLKQDC